MRYINWLFRASLFIALLGFALKNDQPVTLRYFFGFEWQSTVVVVALIFFAAGAMVGVFSMLINVFNKSREITKLKREIREHDKLVKGDDAQQLPVQPSR